MTLVFVCSSIGFIRFKFLMLLRQEQSNVYVGMSNANMFVIKRM